MLGDSSLVATSSDDQTTATRVVPEEGGQVCEGGGAGGFGSNSTEEDKNTGVDHKADRMNYGANRWPRQETLALLKTRSAMDAVFRDSSLKGPLWEDVSRGCKKCKEKFENLYKYHKRIKEGRTDKSEGKTYKFFYELEAFQNHHSHSTQTPTKLPPPLPPPKAQTPTATAATLAWTTLVLLSFPCYCSINDKPYRYHVSSIGTPATIHTINAMPLSSNYRILLKILTIFFKNLVTHLFSSSTSSSTASDEKMEGGRKEREKLEGFFLRLTRDVIKKQEDLQKRFLETVDKCEHERMASEEAWRMKEIARMNREHEALIQERSMAASKDAAFLAFLQKITGQQNSTETQAIPQPKLTPPPPQPPQPGQDLAVWQRLQTWRFQNGIMERMLLHPALLDGQKRKFRLLLISGSIFILSIEKMEQKAIMEDISAGMQKLGYNRSSKRCKEKWENINKYFKKVKESSRKRPEDSKTCPYFDQLDALYKEKNIMESAVSTGYDVKPISTMEPLMVLPEQQLPFEQANLPEKIIEDNERDINFDPNIEEDDEIYDDGGGGGDTEQEEDEGGDFEVAAHKPASLGNAEVVQSIDENAGSGCHVNGAHIYVRPYLYTWIPFFSGNY
uniref:Myb/SANT-like DNA-binding domain-containing protein n=1 Tax=Salix viminalis TaxID=40686 RepID=A0A6N2NJ81_SALVM